MVFNLEGGGWSTTRPSPIHFLKGEKMIRVISSRKLRFYSPDRKENVVTEGKNVIQDLPDWVVQDGMFKLAKNSGIIQILSSRSFEKVAESNPEKVVPQSAHEEAPVQEEVQEEVLEEAGEPTLEPGGGAEVEEPEYEDKAAAKKAARAARRAAKKEK